MAGAAGPGDENDHGGSLSHLVHHDAVVGTRALAKTM